MEEQERKEFINIFNEGFEKVILPYLETIQKDIDALSDKVWQMDRKLDSVVNFQDRFSLTLKNHDKRLTQLEH